MDKKIFQIGESSLMGKPGRDDAVYPITLTDATYTRQNEKLSKYVITDITSNKVQGVSKITFTSEDNSVKEVDVVGSDPTILTYSDINNIIHDVFGF